jgi:hypothetical protein
MSITEPGVYQMDDDVYHADPAPTSSLSSSGARKLLELPARFHWERTHPRPPSKAFSIGHAAHALVLGVGAPIVVVDAADWRTKDAKAKRDDALAAGETPLLASEYAQVVAMADAIHEHPAAALLLDPEHGDPERSLFWVDQQTGVWLRCRLDWMPHASNGRMILVDYKTSVSAERGEFARSAAKYGYHQQAAWYMDGVRHLGLADDVAFVFVVQEKEPPYPVSVVELHPADIEIGAVLNRRAVDLFAECMTSGVWPGYGHGIELVELPYWYRRLHDVEMAEVAL